MAEEILTQRDGQVGILQLNRPDALNTLNSAALEQLAGAAQRLDADPGIGCLLLTGGERSFASGTDVAELADLSMVEMHRRNAYRQWQRLRHVRKPMVAAVSGYALGAGCDLMLACDIIVAAETARIALPEIGMGALPGGGGMQRLTRIAGKAHAMDLVLTGRTITAREALSLGLVSRVVPREQFFSEALAICQELAKRPPLAVQLAKEAILQAYETTLAGGLEFERNLYYMLFATADQREGLRAFLEQRPAVFVGR